MLRFGKRNGKKSFLLQEKPIRIWGVTVDNIVTSKLVKTKTNSKYLIEIKFDKAI